MPRIQEFQKNQDNSLLPDIPTDCSAVRIGSCYNMVTRKIMDGVYAIDPEKTTGGNVIFVDGTGVMVCMANASSHASAQNSLFQLTAEASGGYDALVGGINASLGYNMELASASTSQEDSLNFFCSYVFKGQYQQLANVGSDDGMKSDDLDTKNSSSHIYEIMTKDFQDAYDLVVKSADTGAYLDNYIKFIENFGHGCVTKLYLTAGSAFRLIINYDDKAVATQQKFGVSAALSAHYGGAHGSAGVASEWAKELSTADHEAKLDVTFINIPQNAPTADWVNTNYQNFSMLALSKFVEGAKTIEQTKNTTPLPAPKAEGKGPDTRNIPKGKVDPKELDTEIQNKLMANDGFKGTWGEYKAKQKKLYDKFNPQAIVDDAKEAINKVGF